MIPLLNISLAIGGILIIIGIIIILIKWNESIQKKLEEEEAKIKKFRDEIKVLEEKQIPSQNDLNTLNTLARDFFEEKYGLGKDLTYLELSNEFKKAGNKKATEFCNIMSTIAYSDKKNDPKEIKKAIDLFSSVISLD